MKGRLFLPYSEIFFRTFQKDLINELKRKELEKPDFEKTYPEHIIDIDYNKTFEQINKGYHYHLKQYLNNLNGVKNTLGFSILGYKNTHCIEKDNGEKSILIEVNVNYDFEKVVDYIAFKNSDFQKFIDKKDIFLKDILKITKRRNIKDVNQYFNFNSKALKGFQLYQLLAFYIKEERGSLTIPELLKEHVYIPLIKSSKLFIKK